MSLKPVVTSGMATQEKERVQIASEIVIASVEVMCRCQCVFWATKKPISNQQRRLISPDEGCSKVHATICKWKPPGGENKQRMIYKQAGNISVCVYLQRSIGNVCVYAFAYVCATNFCATISCKRIIRISNFCFIDASSGDRDLIRFWIECMQSILLLFWKNIKHGYCTKL